MPYPVLSPYVSILTLILASDFFVHNLPGQPSDSHIKMHAGYASPPFFFSNYDSHIDVDEKNNGALFFWHFENKHIADRPRTVLTLPLSRLLFMKTLTGEDNMAQWRSRMFE